MAVDAASSATIGAVLASDRCESVPGFKQAIGIAEQAMMKAQRVLDSGKAECDVEYTDVTEKSVNMNWQCIGPGAQEADYQLRVGFAAKNLATEICSAPRPTPPRK